MSYKTIRRHSRYGRLQPGCRRFCVCRIAAAHDAHVIGLHAETISAVPLGCADGNSRSGRPSGPAGYGPHRDRRGGAHLSPRKPGLRGVSFEWRSFATAAGYGSAPLIESARSADLLIASQADPSKPSDNQADIDSFLFESGRPVLIIPYIMRQPKPIKRVMIAWNGSKEAARATIRCPAVPEGGR